MFTDYNYEIEIESQMQNCRNEAINKIKQIVKPAYVEEFAKILHYAWQENLPEAEILAETLNLDPIDFVAIANNGDEFESIMREKRFYA